MSLVGFRAQNHPQQARKDRVDDRRTPDVVFAPLHEEFSFTVDAAASRDNAMLPRYFTRADDGLARSWRGERVWCNPPYSDIASWVVKAWNEITTGGCECVVMLLPSNRTEQAWWHDFVEPYRDCVLPGGWLSVRFMRGRIKFLRPDKSRIECERGATPPFGNVLLIWRQS